MLTLASIHRTLAPTVKKTHILTELVDQLKRNNSLKEKEKTGTKKLDCVKYRILQDH